MLRRPHLRGRYILHYPASKSLILHRLSRHTMHFDRRLDHFRQLTAFILYEKDDFGHQHSGLVDGIRYCPRGFGATEQYRNTSDNEVFDVHHASGLPIHRGQRYRFESSLPNYEHSHNVALDKVVLPEEGAEIPLHEDPRMASSRSENRRNQEEDPE